MKIETAVNEVVNGTSNKAQQFQFTLNAKTAQLLADPYADKHSAVIREICCNAHDAHIAAGHPDKPFVVILPTLMDPTLTIIDYGTGIAPDKIGPLYTTYGASDKDNSDDFTGGLGFGSKAPFAVSSQFTVESRINGIAHCYSMFKDEEGIPSFIHLGDIPTELPNGLTVKVPVNKNECEQFKRAAQRILRRFNPLPEVRGYSDFVLEPIQYTLKRSGWRLRSGSEERPLAVQGNVAYPISRSTLGELTKFQDALLQLPIEIDFPMGEIQVPLSREAISYTPRTIAAIKDRVSSVYEEVVEEFKTLFANCKTEWEARLAYHEKVANTGYYFRELLNKYIVWDGVPITSSVMSPEATDAWFPDGIAISGVTRRKKRRSSEHRMDFSAMTGKIPYYDVAKTRFIWRSDLEDRFYRSKVAFNFNKIPYPVEWNPGRYDDPTILIIHTPTEELLNQALEELGHPPYVKLEDLEEPPEEEAVEREHKKRSVTAKLFRTDDHVNWRPATADLTQPLLYIRLHNRDAVPHRSLTYYNMRETAEVLDLMPDDEVVYGVPATHKTLPNRHKTMTLVYDEIEGRFRKWLDARPDIWRVMADHDAWHEASDFWSVSLVRNALGGMVTNPFTRKNSAAAKVFEAVKAFYGLPYKAPELKAVKDLCETFNIKIPKRKPTYDFGDLHQKFAEKYPLAEFLPQSPKIEAPFVDYINRRP
jgi:hypothetical protein